MLEHHRNFVRFKGYFYLNSHLSKLQEEYRKLGVGSLEFILYKSVVTPILEGEKITLRWLEDHNSNLYENLTKCSRHKKIRNLFEWLNEENPSIKNLKRAEQELLQLTKEVKDKLRKS